MGLTVFVVVVGEWACCFCSSCGRMGPAVFVVVYGRMGPAVFVVVVGEFEVVLGEWDRLCL